MRLERGAPGRIGADRHRQLLVARQILGDAVGQADRGEQACPHPRGKGAPAGGDQRQPHAQRIRGDRARIIGRGIKEQIGQRQPGAIARRIGAGGKDQPLGRQPRRRPARRQRRARFRIVVDDPEHRTGNPGDDAAPAAPDRLGQLVVMRDAGEDHGLLGQALLGAGDGGQLGHDAVIGLIAARNPQRTGAVIGLGLGRHGDRVAQKVIEFGQRHRADIAQIGDLHRRRFRPQDRRTRALGQPVQVDQDVDFIGADARGGGLVGHLLDRHMMIERRQHPGAHVAAIVAGGIIAPDLEARAVVAFQKLGDQVAHRMAAEIRRQIADPQPVVGIAACGRQTLRRRGHLAVDPARADPGLTGRIVDQRQRRQRPGILRGRVLAQPRHPGRGGRPGGGALAVVHQMLHHIGLMRVDQQRRPRLLDRLAQPAAVFQQPRHLDMDLSPRLGRGQQLAPGGQGRVGRARSLQRQPAPKPRLPQPGAQFLRRFQRRRRFDRLARALQGDAKIVPGRGRVAAAAMLPEPRTIERRRLARGHRLADRHQTVEAKRGNRARQMRRNLALGAEPAGGAQGRGDRLGIAGQGQKRNDGWQGQTPSGCRPSQRSRRKASQHKVNPP